MSEESKSLFMYLRVSDVIPNYVIKTKKIWFLSVTGFVCSLKVHIRVIMHLYNQINRKFYLNTYNYSNEYLPVNTCKVALWS